MINCCDCQYWVNHGNLWGDCSRIELFNAKSDEDCLAEVIVWQYTKGLWTEVSLEDSHAGLRTHANFSCIDAIATNIY